MVKIFYRCYINIQSNYQIQTKLASKYVAKKRLLKGPIILSLRTYHFQHFVINR